MIKTGHSTADNQSLCPTSVRLQPHKSRRRRRRTWFMRGGSLIVASLAALVTAEIALRTFVPPEGKRLATFDPLLGWRGRPHGTGVYARPLDSIAASFNYNELGFRDHPVTPKSDGEKRLMLLGDSFVESLEVEHSQTFGVLLERLLRGRDSRWDVSVIGSQGYSTAQELLAFGKYQAVVRADIVLLCFYCGNDFEDNQRPRFAYLDDRKQLVLATNPDPAWKNGLQCLQRWLYESSHVVYLLKNSVERLANIDIAPSTKNEVAVSEDYQRNITSQLIERLQCDVHAAGARLAIAIIPARDDLRAGNHDKPQFMKQLCSRLQIPYVDLTSHLQPGHYFDIDLHFNPQGHRVAAQVMDAFLSTELFSPGDENYRSANHGQLSLGD